MFCEIEVYSKVKEADLFHFLNFLAQKNWRAPQDNFFQKTPFFNYHRPILSLNLDNVNWQIDRCEEENFFLAVRH